MGIMLVYDVTNEKTLDNISRWLGYIDEHATPGVQRIIVGNKCDLTHERQVTREQGEGMARAHGDVSFTEVSAKQGVGVEKSFVMLAESILRKNMEEDERRSAETTSPMLVRHGGGRRSVKRLRNNVRNIKMVNCKI